MSKCFPLTGGVHPAENKQQSLQQALKQAAIPKQLILPISQHIGAPAAAIVEVGEKVLAGQVIAAAQGPVSAPVHASSSGTVVAIEERAIPHPSGFRGECIIIDTDGLDDWVELQPSEQPFELSHEDVLEKIRNAGIAGMGGAGFPAAIKLRPPATCDIDTLIINGTECEPYITADDILMQQRAEEIIQGTLLLAQLLDQPQRLVIGVEDNKPLAIAALQAASRQYDSKVEICSFATKYPSGGEKQLIYILTGREVPSQKLPAHIGVVLQNVGTVAAIWDAVKLGRPLVSRITTVVGQSLTEQGNAEVRLGTPVQDLLAEFGFNPDACDNLIAGGPMMGFSLETLATPIVKTSNCLLAPTQEELPPAPPAQACIRCGLCAEACPASLLPQQLYWYAKAQDNERLLSHNLMDCIECGACSFVCPSSIPLVQYYRASKGAIRQAEVDKVKSDRSRQRFEFRQLRLDRAEAEKEAKRQARKKAAELAKQKAAAAKAAGNDSSQASSTSKPADNDLVAAAMARVQNQQTDPAEQLAKLERGVNNAHNRLQSAQQKMAEAEEPQQEKLAARVKQAELRHVEAEQKLSDFNAQQNQSANTVEQQPAAKDDPVAAAIARAQAKLSMSPQEKLQSNLDSLSKRLDKAREKIAQAEADGDTGAKLDAIKTGATKLAEKIATVEKDLAELEPEPAASAVKKPEQDAASAAIEKAKAKASAQASMSDDDKHAAKIESLKQRLSKAELRLNKAEAEHDDNIEAFKTGVEKLKQKLIEMEVN